jgi:hypothetical protein
MTPQNITKSLDKILIALSILERRLLMQTGEIYSIKDVGSDYDCISDDIYYLLAENKVQ